MSYFSRILISTSALIMAAGTASAGDQMFVDFKYNKTAPIEKAYINFKTTARRACQSELRGSAIYSIHHQNKYLIECQNDLMTKVIAATKNDELIAFHAQSTHSTGLIKTAENKK